MVDFHRKSHTLTDYNFLKFLDMVNEMDWATGYIMDYLKKVLPEDKYNNTMVVFSSDNGPYLELTSSYCPQNCKMLTPSALKDGVPKGFGCSVCSPDTVSQTALDKGGKGTTWEGGQHVPTLVWWPNHVTPGTINVSLDIVHYLPF